jgi:hypothetical protein
MSSSSTLASRRGACGSAEGRRAHRRPGAEGVRARRSWQGPDFGRSECLAFRGTCQLTTEMALVWFDGVTCLSLRMPGTAWKRRPTKLPDKAADVLELLEIDKEVYARPPMARNPGVLCLGTLE